VDHVVNQHAWRPLRLKNDFVLALIGYHLTTIFYAAWGIETFG